MTSRMSASRVDLHDGLASFSLAIDGVDRPGFVVEVGPVER